MGWDTEEAINWFLNDEYLYSHRTVGARALKFIWEETMPSSTVDTSQVNWNHLEVFFEEEQK